MSEIIPPSLAVKAMRDSGYKNTAYALAELIDNSVQANADGVEIICFEKYQQINQRTRRRISEIVVLDNGDGMDAVTLRTALQFGNGTHLNDRSGIGRFGMGLPNSSISQCRRVEIWTWQSGPDNAIHSYLDVDEIEASQLSEVPSPKNNSLPNHWRKYSDLIDTSGTLVVWKNFDDYRLSWRGATATLRNTEALVGRLYRKFIDKGQLSIRLLALLAKDDGMETLFDQNVRVNDPLYLMPNSSVPEPFNEKPMFQKWGEDDAVFPIQYDGKTLKVFLRMSFALDDTVPQDNSDRGGKPYGKHAAKNIGVSIVREGRELTLDPTWANSYDPIERWWGVEVEFPSLLDEVFGVTNNKQNATTFSQLAQFDFKAEAENGETFVEFRDRIQSEGDPRALLLPITDYIREQLRQLRQRIKKQTINRRGGRDERYDKPSVEDLTTKKFDERAEGGHQTEADKEIATEDDVNKFKEDLIEDKQYPESVAEKIIEAILKRDRKVSFLTKEMDGYAFFNVEHKQGGLTSVVFNTNHPFYHQLVETLEPNTGDETDAELLDRIHKAADTLKLLFAAWARYEMEEVRYQQRLSDMRQEWGRMARFFLSNEEDE